MNSTYILRRYHESRSERRLETNNLCCVSVDLMLCYHKKTREGQGKRGGNKNCNTNRLTVLAFTMNQMAILSRVNADSGTVSEAKAILSLYTTA